MYLQPHLKKCIKLLCYIEMHLPQIPFRVNVEHICSVVHWWALNVVTSCRIHCMQKIHIQNKSTKGADTSVDIS